MLLYDLTRPPIPVPPERAFGARFSLRVINTFFMNATDDSIHHGNGFDGIVADELQGLGKTVDITSEITFREPLAQGIGLSSLIRNNADD